MSCDRRRCGCCCWGCRCPCCCSCCRSCSCCGLPPSPWARSKPSRVNSLLLAHMLRGQQHFYVPLQFLYPGLNLCDEILPLHVPRLPRLQKLVLQPPQGLDDLCQTYANFGGFFVFGQVRQIDGVHSHVVLGSQRDGETSGCYKFRDGANPGKGCGGGEGGGGVLFGNCWF